MSGEVGVKIKLLRESAVMPRYATTGSAGMDLVCAGTCPVVIPGGGRVAVPTGLSVECDRSDVVMLVFARSGLAAKHGIALANGVGVIDSDYRGEILVALANHSACDYTVMPGDRIAQMIFAPVFTARVAEAAALGETARGDGGFGSTGVGACARN